MPIFGAPEVQYWQVTPLGVQRLQTGKLRSMDPAERQVLAHIVSLGGVAELDEFTVGGSVSPAVIGTSLRHLADLGYITPLAPQAAEPPASAQLG